MITKKQRQARKLSREMDKRIKQMSKETKTLTEEEQQGTASWLLDMGAAGVQMAYDNATIDNLKIAVAVASVIPSPVMPLARAITLANTVCAMADVVNKEKNKQEGDK